MINQWDVLKRLSQFISIDEEGAENALPLCVVNLKKIETMLRIDADKNDIRICEAAACMSYYDYTLRLSSEEDHITSFKAGDVSVSRTVKSLLEHATNLKNDALKALLPLLVDEGFVFCQTGI